ncbi:hypothetical protein B0H17DRAFT_1147332 [Mycena rosella]|uniref:Uncharacterized protein n=1 Tax=Mycena rosella TaxID=1033263 RepID=A0AAD7CLT3_MYCRO|nr:hypothetical protein B0H17DRAFT_1147332 [Mycena rosella]
MSILEKLLGWMRTNCYSGDDLDSYQVSLLGGFLEGDTHQWFITKVDNLCNPSSYAMNFASIICTLHQQYIKSSSAQHTTRTFESVAWDMSTGPEKLMSDLVKHGQAMAEMPSQFILKDRFFKAIPKWIGRVLKVQCGMTAKFTPLDILRSHARQFGRQTMVSRMKKWPVILPSKTIAQEFCTFNRPPQVSGNKGSPSPAAAAPPRPARDQVKEHPLAKAEGQSKVCFSCGSDHYARNKQCPRYSKQAPFRESSLTERPRVTMQCVVESYSDEDLDGDKYLETAGSFMSDMEDPNAALDLDELIEYSDSRNRLSRQYYVMHIDEEDMETLASDTETSVMASTDLEEVSSNESPSISVLSSHFSTEDKEVPFRNYNLGPICMHLATIGMDPNFVQLPDLLRLPMVSLVAESEDNANWLGEPDFEASVIIDVTTPPTFTFRSVEEEVLSHERARQDTGLWSLTALEYDTNLHWICSFRSYLDEDEECNKEISQYMERSDTEMHTHTQYGSQIHAHAAITAEQKACIEEDQLQERGMDTAYLMEPVQVALQEDLGPRAVAVCSLIQAGNDCHRDILTELETSENGEAEKLWERAWVISELDRLAEACRASQPRNWINHWEDPNEPRFGASSISDSGGLEHDNSDPDALAGAQPKLVLVRESFDRPQDAQQATVLLDVHNNVYVKIMDLLETHYLNPAF